jgi:hypothetical protein
VIVDLAGQRKGFQSPFNRPSFRPPFGGPSFNAPAFGFNRPAAPAQWTLRNVSVSGLAERFTEDPEPEYVAINSFNVAAVTLQENNHIVLIDLPTGAIVNHFSAGTTTRAADLKRDGLISFTDTLTDARREPDGIAWINNTYLVTANEGDYDLDLGKGQFTGGRNFTVFNTAGVVVYDEGAGLEMAAAALGLYPDSRSNSKGVEPEGVVVARYNGFQYGFVGAERGNFVAVYNFNNPTAPTLLQILRTGSRPEGLLTLPQRNLFVTPMKATARCPSSVFRSCVPSSASHSTWYCGSPAIWGTTLLPFDRKQRAYSAALYNSSRHDWFPYTHRDKRCRPHGDCQSQRWTNSHHQHFGGAFGGVAAGRGQRCCQAHSHGSGWWHDLCVVVPDAGLVEPGFVVAHQRLYLLPGGAEHCARLQGHWFHARVVGRSGALHCECAGDGAHASRATTPLKLFVANRVLDGFSASHPNFGRHQQRGRLTAIYFGNGFVWRG